MNQTNNRLIADNLKNKVLCNGLIPIPPIFYQLVGADVDVVDDDGDDYGDDDIDDDIDDNVDVVDDDVDGDVVDVDDGGIYNKSIWWHVLVTTACLFRFFHCVPFER